MSTTPELPDVEVDIVDNLSRDRYELWRIEDDGERTFIGFLAYQRTDGDIVDLQHTVISERFSRQGFARMLVTHALENLSERGDAIIPTCSYVQEYLRRFPTHQGLVRE